MSAIAGDPVTFAPLLGNIMVVLALKEGDEIRQHFTGAEAASRSLADELIADGSDARLRQAARGVRAQLDSNAVACEFAEQLVRGIEYELALRATRDEEAVKEGKE